MALPSRTSQILASGPPSSGVGPNESECLDLKVCALYVDGRVRESTLGPSHDITELALCGAPRFPGKRQPAGRCSSQPPVGCGNAEDGCCSIAGRSHIVHRSAGIRSLLFRASWYRDYAVYCGVADDGKKLSAVVFQVGRRKPVLKNVWVKPEAMARPIRSAGPTAGAAAGASHLRAR